MDESKAIFVRVNPELHATIKQHCKARRLSVQQWSERAIRKVLAEDQVSTSLTAVNNPSRISPIVCED